MTDPLPPATPGQPSANTAAAALQQAIMLCTSQGWRLQTSTNNTAVMVSGQGATTNHVLHAILSLFTCGLWLIVWLLIVMFASNTPGKSLLIVVDETGNITYQEGR